MRAALLLVLALSVLVPGCFSGEKDLSLVCERKSGSPWHPYPLEFVVSRTRPADNVVPEGGMATILAPVPDRLLTPGGRPYLNFSATLTPLGEGRHLFEAEGDWAQGARNGTDRYQILLPVADPRAPLDTPAWVTGLAQAAVNDTPGLEDLRAGRNLSVQASWHRDLPGCVRLAYAAAPAAPDAEGGAPVADVHVNLHQNRVVDLVRAPQG